MFRALRTTASLGIATAALAAASIVPAFAATLQPVSYPEPVPHPDLHVADVRVVAIQASDVTDTKSLFVWRVENIGSVKSDDVKVLATCWGEAVYGHQLVENIHHSGLNPGQAFVVSYYCPGGKLNDVYTAIAISSPNDSNPSNNNGQMNLD